MLRASRFRNVPRLVRNLTWESLRADILAGLLGAVLVLPQGVAFGALAGLPPEYGIYTAVVPCIIAALFGSSRHVMSGPTNANSLALFAMLSPLAAPGSSSYVTLALSVTVAVGLMQLVIGALRLGSLTNFISPSVLLGFTCGASSLIALFALKDFFGLAVPAGTDAFGLVSFLLRNLTSINCASVTVALTTLVVTLAVRRISSKLPFMLIGLLAGYATASLAEFSGWFGDQHVAVVGAIPAAIPPFSVPHLSIEAIRDLFGISAALTIVALSQTISVAKMVAARSGQAIDANREFIGQGLSNVAGGFFSAYVSCGSLNRSLPNLEAGARTPLASVFSAVLLVTLVSFTGSQLSQIPLAAIAAMLLLVAWSLFDVAQLKTMAHASRIELTIVCVTYLATIGTRLERAILIGVVLSIAAHMYRTSRPVLACVVPDSSAGRRLVPVDSTKDMQSECPQLKVIRMQGLLYFGAVQNVSGQLRGERCGTGKPKHLLVLARGMSFCDIAGTEMWKKELEARRASGGDLYFHDPQAQVLALWQKSGLLGELGDANLFATKQAALSDIIPRLNSTVCASCSVRLFQECSELKSLASDDCGRSRLPIP